MEFSMYVEISRNMESMQVDNQSICLSVYIHPSIHVIFLSDQTII